MEVRDFLDSCKCVRTSKDFHDNPAPPDFPPLSRGRLPLAEANLIILYRHASVTVFFSPQILPTVGISQNVLVIS